MSDMPIVNASDLAIYEDLRAVLLRHEEKPPQRVGAVLAFLAGVYLGEALTEDGAADFVMRKNFEAGVAVGSEGELPH